MPGRYALEVLSNEQLTPHMRRTVLTGDDLADFPSDQESGYVKLRLTNADGDPVMRSYTVRAFDADRRRLVLDFVDHGDNGPASRWCSLAKAGDRVIAMGPGEKKLAPRDADWVFLAGDLSALPALAVNLEQLPDDMRGYALIEVPSADDVQDVAAPAGVEVRWLVNVDRTKPCAALMEEIPRVEWLDGTPYPWFAAEFEAMRFARSFFRDQHRINRRDMYLSCYWKLGDTDEGMKRAKRRDAELDQVKLAS